jgi:glucose/arabinose dehydrogenase
MHRHALENARQLLVACGLSGLIISSGVMVGEAAVITATPNPVLGGGRGGTTILWDTQDGTTGQVWVRQGGNPAEALFAQGPSGSQTAPWVGSGSTFEFRLYAGTAHSTLLATATVTTGARLWASPMLATETTGTGTTAINWSTGDAGAGQVWVSMNGGAEGLFGAGGVGSQAANWIQGGATYTFTLYAGTARARALASMEIARGPGITASPNPVPAVAGAGTTRIAWNTGTGAMGQVWVSMNGGPEALFAQGTTASQSASWISPGNTFRFALYDGTAHRDLLASTTVTGTAPFALQLAPVVTGLSQPLFATHARDGSGRLYVVQKEGTIVGVNGSSLAPFLDIRSLVNSTGGEQGLLGLAFDPGYATNRRFYVNYTDLGGDTVLARYAALPSGAGADPTSARVLLRVAQPFTNHNGGWLGFGPDGYLYVAMGDGGGTGDPLGNAQNGESLLGKILRIDVSSAQPYTIPATNPFVGVAGMRGEIWSLGHRNPWRPSFDRMDGAMLIADVGQNVYEEVNLERAENPGGSNYGWPRMEGLHCYPSSTQACNQTGLVLPIAEYPHVDGAECSITGGYVYRGARIPLLRGHYLFGDFCSGRIWALRRQADGLYTRTEILQTTSFNLSSFGEDEAGELYVTGFGDGVLYRVSAMP